MKNNRQARHTGEHAVPRTCRRCRVPVLAANPMGLSITADVQPLTIPAELLARLQGRLTFDALTYGLPPRIYLEYRTLDRIRAERKHPVIAQHKCAAPG